MSDLPPGWAWARLDEITEVRLGRQRSPKNHSGDNMRPYLRAANVDWNGLKLDDVKQMNFTDDEARVYRLQPGDIVLGEASGSPSEVGKPALWNGEIEDCCFQNTLLRVRSYGPEPRYLLHFLRSEALRGAFVAHSRGVGIHHLGASRLTSWPVPVPPLAEQRRIVAALEDHLSRLGAADRSINSATSRLTNFRTATVEQLLDPFRIQLNDLASLLSEPMINGRSVATMRSGFPVLRLTALKDGRIDLSEKKHGAWTRDEATPFLVQAGDFFVSRGNGSLKLVGRGGLVDTKPDPVAFPDTLIRIRIDESKLSPKFLSLVWSTRHVRSQVENAARTTAGIYKINQSILGRITLPVPSYERQHQILDEVETLRLSLAWGQGTVHLAHIRARQLCASLLHAAFSGRLVPQDPNDEPASALLERIGAERATTPARRARGMRTRKELAPPATTATTDDFRQGELPL